MRSIPIFLGAAVALVGCVSSPSDFQTFSNRSNPIAFAGYASTGGATVRFECRQPGTSGWTFVDTANAGPTAANPGESTLVYGFGKSLTVPSSCWLGDEFGYRTNVRVREDGALYVPQLYTFTSSGLSCAIGQISSGEDWVTAGAVCNTGTDLTILANS